MNYLEKENFEAACKFIIKIGTLAHRYGSQAKRLESYLLRVARKLGFSGVFRSTPTEIFFAFTHKDDLWHKTYLVHMSGVGLNLAKLAKVGELVTNLEKGNVTLLEADARLDEIDKMNPPYGKIIIALGYALLGAGFAGYLNCGTIDIILSAILSIVVYVIVFYTEKLPERFGHWVPFLCTFTTGVLAALISTKLPEIQIYLITLSTVIYLVPGYTISNGVIELTYKYVLSGIINIVNGLVYLALLFAGAWAGITMMSHFLPVHVVPDTSTTNLFSIYTIALGAGLCLIFQTPKRDYPWALAAIVIAYIGIALGNTISSVNTGNLLGTVFAVIFANVWSEKTNRAASLVLIPALVFLVSGSVGFRGFVALSAGNAALGQQQFLHMFVVAGTIAVGLILGNTIYKPKITL